MAIRSRAAYIGGLALLLAGIAIPAHAQLTTFANEAKVFGAPTGSFIYQDAGVTGTPLSTQTTGTFSLASGSQVNFNYQILNGYNNVNGQALSNAFLTATAVGAATAGSTFVQNGVTYTNYTEAVTNISGSFIAVTPGAGGANNVLSFNFSNGTFSFAVSDTGIGAGTATFSASSTQALNGAPGLTNYSSSFLDFNNPNANNQYYQSEQFSLAISGINTTGGVAGPTLNANNTIQSFAGDQAGTFSSNPVPISGSTLPEPSSIALGVLGAGMTFLPVLRRKRAKKA